MTAEDSLTTLALAAGRGDRAALDQFIRATERDVWRTVAFLSDPGSADDLGERRAGAERRCRRPPKHYNG